MSKDMLAFQSVRKAHTAIIIYSLFFITSRPADLTFIARCGIIVAMTLRKGAVGLVSTQALAAVFADTMSWISTDPSLSAAAADSAARTVLYSEGNSPAAPLAAHFPETVTEVTHERSFAAAMRLCDAFPGSRIAVHNFASATHPGGGVIRGAHAQEECLCRCSTLYPALSTDSMMQNYYLFHRSRHDARYTDAVIYTPDVRIIKSDTELPERLPQNDWRTVDILTCAAPNLGACRISTDELTALHRARAEKLFSVAAAHGAEVLVLGAFGCGAFRNPAALVAGVYRDAVQRFSGCFRQITLAVYCPSHDTRNYDAFADAFHI